MEVPDDVAEEERQRALQRSKSMDASVLERSNSKDPEISEAAKAKGSGAAGPSTAPVKANKSSSGQKSSKGNPPRAQAKSKQLGAVKKSETSGREGSQRKRKKGGKKSSNVNVDVSKPLDYPATPELILEYHKKKAFLNHTEEWLIVELNEFECLVDNYEMIKLMAKHSKFFEAEPDELVEEFFEFVEDVPSYDEIINYDVWQEFRDKKYLC